MSDKQYPQLSSDSRPTFPHEVQAQACGKAIIAGEHAVVYGTHAVAMPLRSMHFHLVLSPHPTSEGKLPQIQLKLAGHEVSPRVHSVVLDAMQLLGLEAFSLHGKSHSMLPIGAGLGSSATLCVAVLRALSDSSGISLSKSQLALFANELEKRFHGNPSGLDTAVVAYEECVLFAKGQAIRAIDVRAPRRGTWEFALIDSHVRASTMAMIRIAEPYFTGPDGAGHLRDFDALSWQVHRGLQEGQATTVGEAMNDCDQLLRAAGVVPESIQEMIKESRRLGVLGAKTTGAGGGGMILVLLDPERASDQVQRLKASFPQQPLYRVQLEASATLPIS